MDLKLEQKLLAIIIDSFTGKIDDKFLAEDLNILAEYIVIRYLKTSPLAIEGVSELTMIKGLKKFINDRFSFIVTFISVINSESVNTDIEA